MTRQQQHAPDDPATPVIAERVTFDILDEHGAAVFSGEIRAGESSPWQSTRSPFVASAVRFWTDGENPVVMRLGRARVIHPGDVFELHDVVSRTYRA